MKSRVRVAPKPTEAKPNATKLADIVVRHRDPLDGRVVREMSGSQLAVSLMSPMTSI
jgi:hypothetical protein